MRSTVSSRSIVHSLVRGRGILDKNAEPDARCDLGLALAGDFARTAFFAASTSLGIILMCLHEEGGLILGKLNTEVYDKLFKYV